jgi:hypothetical protein
LAFILSEGDHRLYRSSGFLMVAEGKRESEMDS